MPRFYVSIPYGWLEAESPMAAVERVIADDPRTDHEGVTLLVREEGANRLVLIVVGDEDEPTPVTQDVMDDWEYLFEWSRTRQPDRVSRGDPSTTNKRPAGMPAFFHLHWRSTPMAHNLEIINGKASFAYANGRPGWHGLGQAIPPGMEHSEAVAELAGLNRPVALAPLYTMVDGQPVALRDKFATVYEDTGFVLGVVGSRYTVVQNATAFGAIDRWLADGRVRYETAGALDEGRKVFILVRIDEDFTIAGTDPVTPYALVTNSHDGSSGLGVKLVSTRVVCQNTLNVALREKGERIGIRHTASAEANIESAAKALGLVSRQQRQMMERFEQLAQLKSGQGLVEQVVEVVAPDPLRIDVSLTERQRNRAGRRHESFMTFLQHAKELPTIVSAGGIDNRWGLFNAATEWLEWVDPTKSTQVLERRMVGSLEGAVSDARQQVYDLLAAA